MLTSQVDGINICDGAKENQRKEKGNKILHFFYNVVLVKYNFSSLHVRIEFCVGTTIIRCVGCATYVWVEKRFIIVKLRLIAFCRQMRPKKLED